KKDVGVAHSLSIVIIAGIIILTIHFKIPLHLENNIPHFMSEYPRPSKYFIA
ncbi:hypothetical protein ACJX0J_035429, partial [Zea mays]